MIPVCCLGFIVDSKKPSASKPTSQPWLITFGYQGTNGKDAKKYQSQDPGAAETHAYAGHTSQHLGLAETARRSPTMKTKGSVGVVGVRLESRKLGVVEDVWIATLSGAYKMVILQQPSYRSSQLTLIPNKKTI